MSLILDALRRADAQRERDPRRGIHAQSTPLADDDDEQVRFIDHVSPARQLLPWAAGVVLVLAALVGWREVRQDPETSAQVRAQAHSLPPLPAGTGPRAASGGLPATSIQPEPAPLAPALPAAPVRAPAASAASAASAAPAATASAVPAARPVSRSLPSAVSALAISGSVYADSPQQRLLIVNGQVHGEGAEPVPGVRVEQIRPNAAVLRHRGQRYEVGF